MTHLSAGPLMNSMESSASSTQGMMSALRTPAESENMRLKMWVVTVSRHASGQVGFCTSNQRGGSMQQ